MPRRLASSVATVAGEAHRVAQPAEQPRPCRRRRRPGRAAPRCRRRTPSTRSRLALGVEPRREAAQPVDATLLADPLDDVRVQRTRTAGAAPRRRRPAACSRPAVASRSQASAGAHRRALGELGADAAVDRRCPSSTSATCTGASSELTRVSTAMSAGRAPVGERARRRRRWSPTGRPSSVDRPAAAVGAGGADHLGDPPAVVPQQRVGGARRRRRAAVVDLQRMVAGAGEERGEVDQPAGIGAVVAVDRLVVVAHAEHRAVGPGEQPDEQQVGRREVLELVDEQQPAGPLRRRGGRRRRRAAARSPARSARRSRARPARASSAR